MAKFVPFKAIRPPRNKAHLVGSRSYVSYSDSELEEKLSGNPYTFLHIIMPEMHAEKRRQMSRQDRFVAVKQGYENFKMSCILEKDEKSAYYLYRQTKGGVRHTGFIGAVAVADYLGGHVKVHEHTLTKRERLFTQYLDFTRFNAEPVLLAYEEHAQLKALQDQIASERAEYEFTTTDTVLHELWIIDDARLQTEIQALMLEVPDVYIADGHHRCASSARLADESVNKTEHMDYFMALLMPHTELSIYEFNRVVSDLGDLSSEQFKQALGAHFEVIEKSEIFKPNRHGELAMYLDGKWYSLEVKATPDPSSPVTQLDSYVLNRLVMQGILGIEDVKTDRRVSFVDGLQGMSGLQDAVDHDGFKVAFGLFPISFEELKAVADANEVMPPKSTWIEPKLRSGLTIYELND